MSEDQILENERIADFLPNVSIKAKDFAAAMTAENVENKDLKGISSIEREHVENNMAVRKIMVERGSAPENLPPAEDVKKVERRLTSDEKKTLKTSDIEHLDSSFVQDIKHIITSARQKAYSLINNTMLYAYWEVGERIVKQEQGGKERAEYGKRVLVELAKELSEELGKGFEERELRRMRQLYLIFPIRETLSPELSWSHYIEIMRVDSQQARNYYISEAILNHWSVRHLRRNISTLYYERLLSSADQKPVVEEMEQKTKAMLPDNREFIKNPYVFEFLNIGSLQHYKEAQLERALIDNLQTFLLELCRGFAFVARQKMVRTETAEFYIDLVFYNYLLKCFVVIDLKTHALQHSDIGQMDMYVRMFDDLYRGEHDNPTIGLLLCTETDKTIAKYSVLKNSEQLFASKYKLLLPSEEQLRAEIEREKEYYESVTKNQNDE